MKIRREDLKDLYPLSPMQEGMLFHARQAPDGAAYVEQVVWRVDGPFEVAAYRAAWEDVHARYDALRSVFTHEKSREPLQLVLKHRAADFQSTSLLDLPADARPRRSVEMRANERATPFDLSTGPLLRIRVLQVDTAAFEVILTWHHIVLDGWSTHAMLQDLAANYTARVAGAEARLPPLPSYAPYVDWLATRDRAASLAYWRTRLEHYDAVAEIPRLTSPRNHPFVLNRVGFQLDADLHQRLHALAAALDATPSSLLQAAWGVLLARYQDTDDVVFGAVVSGRSPDVPGIERVAGLLINTIPVRVTTLADDTFAALVGRVQHQSVESQAHHASRLADIQQQSALGARLITHLLVFENYPVTQADASMSGLTVRVAESSEPTTYDMVVVVEPATPLRIVLQFNASVYAHAYMAQVARHFEQWIRQAVLNPDAPLNRLDVMSPSEATALGRDGNETDREYPRESHLAAEFARSVERHASRVALSSSDASLSYGELDRRSNQLAQYLIECGVRPGDRVATALKRSAEMVEAVLALVKIGAAYVPHDPEAPAERLAFVVDDAGIRTVIASVENDVRLPDVRVIRVDVDAARIRACASTPPVCSARAGDEAMMFYTSGSTGQPKAVRVPHRAVLRLVLNTDYVSLGPETRMAHISNVAFDAATFEIWGALLNGASLHPLGKDTVLTPGALSRELRAQGITTMFLTTALFNQVAREVPDAFATLDTVLFGGELVEPRWVKRVIARGKPARLLHVYGPTETCTFATWFEVTSVDDGVTIPIGRAVANTTAYVVDRQGRLQPAGASGELLIGGDGVALGYHNRPELTAAAFVEDTFGAGRGPLYRTGDVVRRNLDGDIEFLGRRDSQVKLRGFRIELGEIEAALRALDGVGDALVILHRDEASGDRRLVAYLAAPAAAAGTIELLARNHLRGRLPGYMIPSMFVVVDRFPLNANGKIDRKALPAPARSGMGFARTFVEPATDLERRLAAIWQTVLGARQVGQSDNFFELGGHSLTASTAISHIRAELKVDVPIAAFFEAATLGALASLVDDLQRRAGEPRSGVAPIARQARRAPGTGPS